MTLDIHTLLVINAANVMLMALTLPFIMGRRLSPAADSARSSFIVQGVGWVALIFSSVATYLWADLVLSTISMTCLSVGQWLMFKAMEAWLGPRRGGTLLRVVIVLTPIGYALTFQNYALRVGWSNGLIALQALILALSTLRPTSQLGGSWRWVVFGCALTMSGFTAARGVMGAFLTDLYPHFLTPHPVNIMAMLAANVTLVLGNLAILVAWREEAEAQLREQASTDSLTGLPNRHGWNERALALFDQARRHGTPLALIMLDLDHFKRINDTLGHEVGDLVLKMFGEVANRNRRSSDLVARIGGEEFALLLPQTDQAAAVLFEQRLRQALREASQRQPQLAVDYSAGLAMLRPEDDSLTHFMVRADNGLYLAKSRGRGCLQIAD